MILTFSSSKNVTLVPQKTHPREHILSRGKCKLYRYLYINNWSIYLNKRLTNSNGNINNHGLVRQLPMNNSPTDEQKKVSNFMRKIRSTSPRC